MPDFHLERLDTPTGPMLIASDGEDRVRAVDWEDYEHRMHALFHRRSGAGEVRLSGPPARPSRARLALEAYFAGDLSAVDAVETADNGTAFQRRVWRALRDIPVGGATTYGALANTIDHPKAVRAVGLANGSNPIAIIVPCHRVIGADASLTGYGGGLDRKRWLLAHEGVAGFTQLELEARP